MANPHLSLVVPAFNEELNLAPLVDEIRAALAPLTPDWELLLIDDGSTDGSLAEMLRLRGVEPRIRVLRHLAAPDSRRPWRSASARRAARWW